MTKGSSDIDEQIAAIKNPDFLTMVKDLKSLTPGQHHSPKAPASLNVTSSEGGLSGLAA